MIGQLADARTWARDEFSSVALGDARRRARCIQIAARAAASPSGRISDVFDDDAERQGAYDFLESEYVHREALTAAMTRACAERCADEESVFVPIDGTSIHVVDRERQWDFGAIGSYRNGARGFKVITALAVTMSGVPLGICAQFWWQRPTERPPRIRPSDRLLEEKETRFWIETIQETRDALASTGCRPWIVMDAEADAADVLLALGEGGNDFTVRAARNRCIDQGKKTKEKLMDRVGRESPLGSYSIDLPKSHEREARRARLELRSLVVTLDYKDTNTKKHRYQTLTAVLVREVGTVPPGEPPIEWILLTNRPAWSMAQARLVVRSYTARWCIEVFHKTWKTGRCCVEDIRLRSAEAVKKWATILAAVAIRIERLKMLSRAEPEQPASVELTKGEIRALLVMKRDIKKRTETIPETMPTIRDATRWIAELGGYTGKSSGGPPGSITIGRGFKRVRDMAKFMRALERQGYL